MISVGVVGLGNVAQLHHLPALSTHPDFSVDAVCDWSAETAEAVAEQYHAAFSTTDMLKLITSDVDVVVITNRDHHRPLLSAIAAGKTVLVEKPMVWNSRQSAEVIAAVERTNARVMVGYMKLADPAVTALRDWTAAREPVLARLTNRAGGRHKVDRVHTVRKPTDLSPEEKKQERDAITDSIRASLGTDDPTAVAAYFTLLELASHDLSLLRHVTRAGCLEVEHARAARRGDVTVFDIGLAADGLPVRLECLPSFGSPRGWDEELTVYTADDSAGVAFTSPFLREGATTLVTRAADDTAERSTVATFTHQSPYRLQLDQLRALAEEGVRPAGDPAAAAADIDLVTRIVTRLEYR
jgi:predicted dehydrogenase